MDAPSVSEPGSPPNPRVRHLGRVVAAGTLIAAITAGSYVAVCAIVPLPELRPALLMPATTQISADPAPADAVVETETLPTAFGWASAEEIWANDADPHPLASLTKLVTVLVGEEAEPLEPGSDGPGYIWTEADVQRQAELIADDGIAFPVPAGTEFSQRDMLTLMLLPSANDFAEAYANSIFGDNEAFTAAVADWAKRNGIESLTVVEPSGMSGKNQASAADLVRIARLALADPTLVELTSLRSAEIPGIGEVENSNPLLGRSGIIGLKTGHSSDAGYNLVAAQRTDVDGRALTKVSVVLGRPSPEERAASSWAVLRAMDSLDQPLVFVSDGEKLGSVVTWTGQAVPLLAGQASNGVVVPGEEATRTVEFGHLKAGPTGQTAGTVAVRSPIGAESVPIITGAAIAEPDLWWRLSNPGALFGW